MRGFGRDGKGCRHSDAHKQYFPARSATKPDGCASRYSNHSIPPESVSEETRLGPANKIFLVTVIGRVWLHDKTLREIVSTRTEAGAVAIEIYFIRHVIKGPNAVALTASER